jgi:Leucine-rich repeat (LRR) protein
LPTLNENLHTLGCSNNQLRTLPTLTENLEELYFHTNPIYKIIYSNNLFIIKQNLKILHEFCHLYYCLKFKKQFRDLLWKKIREPKIIQNYHPSYLEELLTDENVDIDVVLNSWL